ncbi:MAG: biopolymer transporter ExbD [Chthoniobacteraceae bacterium]
MNFLPRRRRKPEVIIVSLIDIFAILLIFVIVTTTFKSEQPAVTIRLPESKTAVVADRGDEALKLSISEKEEIFLGAKKIALPELRAELDRLLALPNPPKLALAADRRAPVGMLISVLDVLKQAGVKGELAAFTESAPQ